jgi:carbamoyltransferase
MPPHLRSKYFSFFGERSFTDEFFRRVGIPVPTKSSLTAQGLDFSMRANIAASLQMACAVVLTEWLDSLRKRTKESRFCLAVGLFLNPLLVSSVERNTGFERVFVQPAAGNEGTALGAAWLAWHQGPSRPRVEPMSDLYRGPQYSNQEINEVPDNSKAPYRWGDSEDHKIEETLRLLLAGKIVAWFQGAAEFGPRALGNRSLLAYPWAPYVNENMNDYIKHRESFRPFALSVPSDVCSKYFDCSPNAHFMSTMATAKPGANKLLDSLPPGFLNGNLVRLHVVTHEENPLFWNLLKKRGGRVPHPCSSTPHSTYSVSRSLLRRVTPFAATIVLAQTPSLPGVSS